MLAVNTRKTHVELWTFIDLVSADTARLSQSSVGAHKRLPLWRHTHTHIPRQWRERKISLSLSLASLGFLLPFSLAVYLPLLFPPPNTSHYFRDYFVFLHFHNSEPHQVGICVQSCHFKPFLPFVQIIYRFIAKRLRLLQACCPPLPFLLQVLPSFPAFFLCHHSFMLS